MTLYHLLATNQLRSSATSGNVPALSATLRSDFAFDMAFVNLAGVVAPLEAPEGGSVAVKAVIKAGEIPESPVVLLDAALDSNNEAGTARRYSAVWTAAECDSPAFRLAVKGKTAIKGTLEIEVTHAAGTARATCPIILINAFLQPTDAAPNPGEDASWAWLKARLNAGDNVSFDYDEEAKELEINADGVAAQISAAAEKTTPVDADKFGILDSAASFAVKWLSWTNIKATLKTYFDTLYALATHNHSAADLTSGTIPDAQFPATLPALNGSALTNLNASAIATGTIDVARLPYVASGVQVVSSGAISALTSEQQTEVVKGAVVTTTDGRRWIYSGSGSKTSEASYIESADVTPAWAVIADKPTEFPPEDHSAAKITSGTLGAARLPVPGTTTLGGVMRNTGSAGQFVTGIHSDGSLLRDTPAGGGGALVRGDAVIQGHTTPAVPAGSPPLLSFAFAESGQEGNISFQINGSGYTVNFSATEQGGYWYDTSSNYQPADLAAGFVALLTGVISGVFFADVGGGGVTIDNTEIGSAYHTNFTSSSMSITSPTGGGSGTDEQSATGAVTEATLVALASSKTTKAVRVGCVGAGVNANIQLALKTAGGSYSPLGTFGAMITIGELLPSESTITNWLTGVSEAHIVARMVDESGNNIASEDIPDGGSLTLWAFVEQV